MRIENRDEYKEVNISELGLSTRTFNALMRANCSTLYLIIENADNLASIRNMGAKSVSEVEMLLEDISVNGLSANRTDSKKQENTTDTQSVIVDLSNEILLKPATDLKVTERIKNSFRLSGIKTIYDVISLQPDDIRQLKNIGTLSQQQLMAEIEKLRQQGKDYFTNKVLISEQEESKYSPREFDIDTAKNLSDNYGLKIAQLCEWYGLSRQGIYHKFNKRVNHGKWCGKELLPEERAVIIDMINSKRFFCKKNDTNYYLFNNALDDCAFVIVTDYNIKCLFLGDLPAVFQARIKDERLNVLTEKEIKALPSLGKEVFILKKKYFIPTDSQLFRTLAGCRSMSNDEYSLFLFGVPYCTAQTTVTDDRIIDFLNKNTINGKTFIPPTPDNHWIRSYISRSGYSTSDFIKFYGFNVTGDDENGEFNFADDINIVERDMQTYSVKEGFVEKLFAETPLLGSRLISEKNLKIIYQNSKKFIGQLLNNSYVKANLKVEMQITLAVINYAKGWDTEDESGFWKYITSQFGYRDESGQLRNLLCNCIKDALIKNGRWFITNSSGNMFKSSIMVHSFSTKKSWLYFCDFLFDFYKTNLDWQYVEDDPMFARIVFALRNRFRDSEETDKDIEISTKVYYFREGIIKLIIHRPKYTTKLISKLIKRIDALINHTAQPASCYEEQLCDEWMANKIQGITSARNREKNGEKRKIAIDYTKIRPVYRLINERDIKIIFPDVRLAENDFRSLQLTVIYNGKTVEQRSLSFYGNEFGKTMIGFSLALEDYFRRSGSANIDPQVIITCDSKEIYNSGKSLYRVLLVFKEKSEIDIGSCEPGNYSFFSPKDSKIDIINADRTTIFETCCLNGEYIKLKKDFAVSINGELVSFDDHQSTELRVMIPNTNNSTDFISNGIRYSVISGKEAIHIISPNRECEKKYILTINEDVVDLDSLLYENNGDTRIYRLELSGFRTDELVLKVINFATDHLVLCRFFKIIPSLVYKFNKNFFFETEDYYEAKLRIKTGKEFVNEFPVFQDEQRLIVPYQNGDLEIAIPVVSFVDNTDKYWTSERILWIKDIPQDCFIYAKVPAGISVELFLDNISVAIENAGTFAFGNTIAGFSNENNCSWLKVYAAISDGNNTKKYCIGNIAVKEQFIQTPVLKVIDNKLTWNLGYKFIGDLTENFKISVCCGTKFEQTIPLDLQSETIVNDISLPLGEYQFKIIKQSGNLFAMQLQEIASGVFFVGDENELRFLDHIIKIDTITFENEKRYEAVKIRTCYIDKIKYNGIQYVGTEDRECPIYTGTLFFVSNNGKRHEYSFTDTVDDKEHKIYQINPVKIVYINDHTLSITNESGEGLYYYKFYDKFAGENKYQLTDWEPTRFNQNKYYLADLFSYTRKEVK